MNILFVTFYYPPEVGAPQRRISEYAAELKKRGHRVSILTGFPNYPRGELIPPYRRRLYLRENLDGIEVLRVFHFLGNRQGKFGRALAEVSFAISASVAVLLESAPDVVVVESPSFFSGWIGTALKRLRQVPFVLHIADPILEAAAGMRLIQKNLVFRTLIRVEDFFYRNADRLVTVSPGISRILAQRGVPSSKVVEIPNGLDDKFFERLGRMNLEANGRSQETRVVYAGNHGMAQKLTVLLDAASLLGPTGGIRFHFYGDGVEKPGLVRKARDMGLANVSFFEPVSPTQMVEVLSQADIWAVPLADSPGLDWAIPSKLLEGMAAGLPVTLAARGEAALLLQQAEAGLVVKPGDPSRLAEAIRQLRKSPEQARKMGENGRAFVGRHFLRSMLTDKLEMVLKEVAERNRRP
ncbi:MAG: glycosyltransferase family 4 protein [Candidatus Zixiibacteriota bacterium]